MQRALSKRRIANTDLHATFLGFGALEIGRNWGMGSGDETLRPDDKEAGEVLNYVLDLGINLVDTAAAYHQSERRIGDSISPRRSEYILASKCGEHSDDPHTYYDFSYKAIKASIDKSLKLLKTDVIDIMQIHFGPDPEKTLDDGETVGAMKDAQKEGKIKLLGASIGGDLGTRCIMSGDFDVMQIDLSLLNRYNEENIRLCKERGIAVFIRSGLGVGRCTEKAPMLLERGLVGGKEAETIRKLLELCNNDAELYAALSLRFLYNNDGITSILAGSKKKEHIKRNIELLNMDIDESLLAKAGAIVKA